MLTTVFFVLVAVSVDDFDSSVSRLILPGMLSALTPLNPINKAIANTNKILNFFYIIIYLFLLYLYYVLIIP